MTLNNYKPLLTLTGLTILAYIVHKVVFHFLALDDTGFLYSLEKLYLLFLGLSILVFIVLLRVKERSFDNVGLSFLWSTSLKMVFCFLLLKPILKGAKPENVLEKMNFFVMFILFLIIETVLAIRILNKKQ